jgi:hypothetical protein
MGDKEQKLSNYHHNRGAMVAAIRKELEDTLNLRSADYIKARVDAILELDIEMWELVAEE